MNIKIAGAVGKQEILEFLAMALNTLEKAGVDEFKGVNLYVSSYVSGERVVPQIDNEPFVFHFTSTNKHVEHVNEDGLKKKVYKKCSADDINLNGIFQLSTTIQLPTEKSIVLERERQLAVKEQERAEVEHHERMQRQQKAIEDKIAKQCRESVRGTLGFSVEEFKTEMSSCGWINSRKYIEKYSSDLSIDKAFRVSMKIKDSEDLKVYLFSTGGSLVYEGAHGRHSVQRN